MARDEKGRFIKGSDPDRYKPPKGVQPKHKFTTQECKDGYLALIRKMPAQSWSLSVSQAHRVVTKTLYIRDGLTPPTYPEKVVFGVNKSDKKRENWIRHGTKG